MARIVEEAPPNWQGQPWVGRYQCRECGAVVDMDAFDTTRGECGYLNDGRRFITYRSPLASTHSPCCGLSVTLVEI